MLDSESGQSVTVTVGCFGPDWEQDTLLLEEREAEEWRRATNQVQTTRRGIQIARLRPDVVYRLTLPAS